MPSPRPKIDQALALEASNGGIEGTEAEGSLISGLLV